METLIAAFYHFAALADPGALRAPLQRLCTESGIKGSILLAPEGINGTVAGPAHSVHQLLGRLRSLPGLERLEHKTSYADEPPFRRMKVRLKREIVTLGIDGVDPTARVGTYVPPQAWNALISDPDVLLIDTRNRYEYEIGTFRNALDPGTDSFRDFPEFVRRKLRPHRQRRLALFCTGGIRCEKATSYLLQQNFETVYHLQGGILKYLEEIPQTDSLWEGECFVFDDRTSVDHTLRPGGYRICRGCQRPVPATAPSLPADAENTACAHCIGTAGGAGTAEPGRRSM